MMAVGRTKSDRLTCESTGVPLAMPGLYVNFGPPSIKHVDHDEATLTTFLAAQPAPWTDVAGTFDLDFGKVANPFVARRLRSRGLFGDVGDAIGDAADTVGDAAEDAVDTVGDAADDVGDAIRDAADTLVNQDLEKAVSFSINTGTEGQRSNVFTDPIS